MRHQLSSGEVTVRRAELRDTDAIERLAQRDSKQAPRGDLLVAEMGGSILAATSIDHGGIVADPFHRTRDAVDLLELRVTQLRSQGQEKGRGVAAAWLARRFIAGRHEASRKAVGPRLAER